MRLSEAIDLLDSSQLRALRTPGAHANSTAAPAASAPPQKWADLGCSSGLFTEALARFLPAGSTIYGLDLRPTLQSETVNDVSLIPIKTDFVNIPLPLSGLDGILMANSFHYVQDKAAFLKMLITPMHPSHPESAPVLPGKPLLFVEYDTDQPVQTWVPYPVSFASLQTLLTKAGWPQVHHLGQRPSQFGHANLYAALAWPVNQ